MSTTIDPAADPFAALRPSEASLARSKADDPGSADRFLKMLVTQLQNQDPLNPMDNAQITSQIAQINAVTGLEKVNASIQSLSGQFLQLQLLQGAALVGREVLVKGNVIKLENGVGRGAIELDGPATSVKVEILGAGEQVVDTLELGALDAGRSSFEWDPGRLPTDVGYGFRVTAFRGQEAVSGRTLSIDQVQSVGTVGGQLELTLRELGATGTGNVVAFR
ncbi:MAG TPA: flagellar hook capping FlgD N-terminal domain-containing protein [Rubrivivax sp.]|nr:flagellar hook assembly protein FlgD [Burkholderiales bacterium]HNU10050.1 flagellar hook capping FlgD N-terminal domain-containing protein [Rubrivivax sp.]